MASIENRSNYQVTVKNRDDLTKSFPHTAKKKAEAYKRSLEAQNFKPRLIQLENAYSVRDRSVSRANQALLAHSKAEAETMKEQLENEHKRSIFVDYGKGFSVTFADLLTRYLREIAPRLKSFEVIGYKINAMLQDAGLARQNIAEVVAAHPNPHAKAIEASLRKPTGKRAQRAPCSATKFIRGKFAELSPDDFIDYIDERCEDSSPATIDREIDIFSAVCTAAIEQWRISVKEHPLLGVARPKYYNERDRRLKADEEDRLLFAASEEDKDLSISRNLELLMARERSLANNAPSTYKRKLIIKEARKLHAESAAETYDHISLIETWIHFQLMTGARRGESLSLTWENLDLEAQTAFFPETKNGRPRKVPIRRALAAMLRDLPRTSEFVFPISVPHLRAVWRRICARAGLTDDEGLHIHDLRHEAISRLAEASRNLPGGFSLIDLQHFSGHRDTRMLLRYAHLCTQGLAAQIDTAFAGKEVIIYRGRRRPAVAQNKEQLTTTDKSALSDHAKELNLPPREAPASSEAPHDIAASSEVKSGAKVIHVVFGKRAA